MAARCTFRLVCGDKQSADCLISTFALGDRYQPPIKCVIASQSGIKLLKRVLVIGADFAPSSYPPALRLRFFAQHLKEFGWEPIIVTTDPRYYENEVDEENQKLLPSGLEVIRTRAIPAALTRKFNFGDLGLRSLWHHWQAMKRVIRQTKIDLVFISVPPNPTMILGRLAHARFGVPYVLDYLDPVITEYHWQLPRSQRPPKFVMAYTYLRVLENLAVAKAAELVAVSKGTFDGLAGRHRQLPDVAEIPFGVEPADFQYLREHSRKNPVFDRGDGLLHVSYVGRGGADMLPALRAVFRGVIAGLERWPELFQRLRLHFVGTTYAYKAEGQYQVLPLARELNLEQYVHEHPGRVPYLTAMQIMLDSHALLIVGSELPHYTASKVFPYIVSARPLLAVFHEKSSVVTILRETNAGTVVTFGDGQPVLTLTDGIAQHLRNLLALPPASCAQTRWEAFERYTARAMTARLAEVFDESVRKKAVRE